MSIRAVLAVESSFMELLMIIFIVLVPTVPVTFVAWNLLERRRGRTRESLEQELEAGRSAATPFAVISVVGSVIAVAAFLTLLLVIAVRAAAA
jgi:hypothetical protein